MDATSQRMPTYMATDVANNVVIFQKQQRSAFLQELAKRVVVGRTTRHSTKDAALVAQITPQHAAQLHPRSAINKVATDQQLQELQHVAQHANLVDRMMILVTNWRMQKQSNAG